MKKLIFVEWNKCNKGYVGSYSQHQHIGTIYDETPLLETLVKKLYWTNKVTDSDLGSPYIEFSSGKFYTYRFYKNR